MNTVRRFEACSFPPAKSVLIYKAVQLEDRMLDRKLSTKLYNIMNEVCLCNTHIKWTVLYADGGIRDVCCVRYSFHHFKVAVSVYVFFIVPICYFFKLEITTENLHHPKENIETLL